MKKILSLFLAILLLTTNGCSDKTKTDIDPQNILEEYLQNVEKFEAPIREFGDATSYVDMTEDMVTGILYSETEYEFFNSAVREWSLELAENYKDEATENKKKEEPSELTVDYESYIITDNLASVKMKGVFISPHLAHPIDIYKTFNVNTNEGKILSVEDIFTPDGLKEFQNRVAKTAGVSDALIDENFANNFLLLKDGIEIILVRGDYLPMSDGTKSFVFKYDDIKNMLDSSFELKPVVPEKEETEIITIPEVKVEKENPTAKKMVALTFDDGPSVHTDRLLDLFSQYGGKGTFFVVGNRIDNRSDTILRMQKEGHQIANHSWDHRQLTSLDSQGIKDQIMMTRAKIYDITGVDTVIVRPPYGSCDDFVKSTGKELGVSFVNWSIDTLDWKTRDADSVYNEIMQNVKDGSIILCHDLYESTVEAMERAIPELIENGYELVTVSELLGTDIQPGKMYYRK